VPPFSNLKARQAVSYAVDRARIVQLFRFAPGQAAVTCQIIPPDFPGHQSYCPYTSGANDGTWHGPDMRKARRLAKQSGTTNVPVTVWAFNDHTTKQVGRHLVRLLDDVGYQARLYAVPIGRLFREAPRSRSKIQIGVGPGWGPDFPAPSTFFVSLLSCRSLYQPPAQNWSGFCDPRLDSLASDAQTAQLTDPATARSLWARADRLATGQAPLVALYDAASTAFVSDRAGNYHTSPEYGDLLDQMWVR